MKEKMYKRKGFKIFWYVLANIATIIGSVAFVLFGMLLSERAYSLKLSEIAWDEYISMINYYHSNYPRFIGENLWLILTGRYVFLATWIVCTIIDIIAAVLLFKGAGLRKGEEEPKANWFDKIPFDIILAVLLLLAGMLISYAECDIGTLRYYQTWFAIPFVITAAANLGFITIYNIIIRVRLKTLYKNTVIYWLGNLIFKGFKKIWNFIQEVWMMLPLIWRTMLTLIIFLVVELLMQALCWYEADKLLLLWVIKTIILVPFVLYLSMSLRKLQELGERIAAGDISYRIDEKWLKWDFRKHAENLNSISDGIEAAVNERLKSEHMKTELITNVSHDIKTPLTSIINYATLIGEEETNNEKIKEYTEVLIRQSTKLKRLTEDLVEASKASTGNLDVEMQECDASVFLTQASGEYEEKLTQNNLTLVVKEPSEEIRILADGRRMWRVFDNLMNNICKYSLPNSRVYLSLESVGDKAVFTFKNTSKDELDITEEELVERFVRGDKSRNTEGNGLGLSIAKSLTELQKGQLNISIDGDLFKATLSFPKI